MAARGTPAKKIVDRSCKEIAALIFDYLNNELSLSTKREFEAHLRICPDCVNFLNTYKKTVKLSRTLRYETLPDEVRKNVRNFLKRKNRHTKGG